MVLRAKTEMKSPKKNIDQRGNTILIGLISVTILGTIAVGVGRAFWGMGRQKANTQARIGVIDYEDALVSAVGEKILAGLISSSCSPTFTSTFFNNLDIPLASIGSAVSFSSIIKAKLSSQLDIQTGTPGANQISLKTAFESCIDQFPGNANSPGIYLFCLGLKGPIVSGKDQSFQGMLGAFAKFRVELGSRDSKSNDRVFTAMSCNEFKSMNNRELKISYQLHYKKFKDDNGIFMSSGSKFYSAP